MACRRGSRKKLRPRVTPRIGSRADGEVEVIGGSRAAEALEPAHQREGAMPRQGEVPNRRSQAHLVMLCTG